MNMQMGTRVHAYFKHSNQWNHLRQLENTVNPYTAAQSLQIKSPSALSALQYQYADDIQKEYYTHWSELEGWDHNNAINELRWYQWQCNNKPSTIPYVAHVLQESVNSTSNKLNKANYFGQHYMHKTIILHLSF